MMNNNTVLYEAHRSSLVGGKSIGGGIGFITVGVASLVSAFTLKVYTLIATGTVAIILGILVMLINYLVNKNYKMEFYQNKIVVKRGILNKREEQQALTKILGVSVSQTLVGRIFNYGTVKIDKVGQGDYNFGFVKNPYGLKKYVETIIAGTDYDSIHQVVTD